MVHTPKATQEDSRSILIKYVDYCSEHRQFLIGGYVLERRWWMPFLPKKTWFERTYVVSDPPKGITVEFESVTGSVLKFRITVEQVEHNDE